VSGQAIGTTIGFVVGSYFGPVGGQIGALVGGYIGGSFDHYNTPGPRLGDIPAQTSQEGAARPICYGTPPPFFGNVMQAGPQNRVIVKEKIDSGKGGPTNTTDHEEVYQTFAIRVCEGEVDLLRFWIEGKLAYSALGELPADSTVANTKFKFYRGDEEQMPDPSLEALPPENGGGVGNVTAYRGTAYAVFDNFNSTPYGGRIPQIQFQVSTVATIEQNCTEEGLVFWYPLDDVSPGGPARELVAGRNGLYSSTVSSGGPLGNGSTGSMVISEDSDWMIVRAEDSGFAPVSLFGVPYTVSVWLNQSAPTAHDFANVVQALSGTGAIVYSEWQLGFAGASFNVPYGGSANSGGGLYMSAGVPGGGMLTLTSDGTTRSSFYLNGEFIATGPATPQALATLIQIGEPNVPANNGFRGQVSDLRGYNYEMTAQQVADAYLGVTIPIWELPDAPGMFIDSQGNIVHGCQDTATLGTTHLDAVAKDISFRTGVLDSQVDYNEAATIVVDGYLLGQQTTGQDALGKLTQAYFGDVVENDLKLRWVPRGNAVVAAFTDDDFVESNEDERYVTQAIEQPRDYLLAYADKDSNYARRIQKAGRESINFAGTSPVQIEFPLVFDSDEAAQKIEIVSKILNEARLGTLKRKLPGYKWAFLTVSDRVSYDGKEWRITKLDWLDGLIDFEAVRDRVSNYSSVAVGGRALDPSAPVSNVRGPSILQALNLPRLSTAENVPGMYLAVTGLTSAWPGADIYAQWPGTSTEVKVLTITKRATMGELVSDITASSEPITVLVYNERLLSSITMDQASSGLNGAAITSAGVSELAQFLTAAESADAEFELTDTSRGLRNTVAASHVAGDQFLLLDDALVFLPIDASYIGQDITFRAVTRGTPIENNDTITVTFDPIFTGPATVDFVETLDGDYVETLDGARVEFLSV